MSLESFMQWTVSGLVIVGLSLTTLIAWALTLFGLPGNWLIVAVASASAWWMPPDKLGHIGWPVVIALVALAAVGELLEFLAGAVGAQRAGGGRRAALFALVGSLMGSVFGAFAGVPVPVVGPVVGVILFSGIGALVGAMVAESSRGSDRAASWRIGQGAFWGRLAGTGAKTLLGAVMVGIVLVAMFI